MLLMKNNCRGHGVSNANLLLIFCLSCLIWHILSDHFVQTVYPWVDTFPLSESQNDLHRHQSLEHEHDAALAAVSPSWNTELNSDENHLKTSRVFSLPVPPQTPPPKNNLS